MSAHGRGRAAWGAAAMRGRALLMMLASLLLSSCALAPPPATDPIIVNGNSQFTKAGIKAMKSSRQVSFDFTSLPLDMAALGLDENSDGAMVATDTDRRMRVAMTTPSGVVQMETDTSGSGAAGLQTRWTA